MQAPLKFSAAVSSLTNGLVRAFFPPDGAHVDFFLIDGDEEICWLSSSQNVSFGVKYMVITPSGITSLQNGTSISFEEHLMSGGWALTSVMDDPLTLMNRTYADNRYIQRSGGITITHTIQVGEKLVIADGIITAILPAGGPAPASP